MLAKREAINIRMNEIEDKAQAGKREFSAEENVEYQKLQADFAKVGREIAMNVDVVNYMNAKPNAQKSKNALLREAFQGAMGSQQKEFAVKTLLFSVVYSVIYLLLQKSGLESIQYNAQGHDTIYPVIISGVISGFVYGTCFRNNASTGGTDIISRYINKVNPATNFFIVTFLLNTVVAIVSLFVYSESSVDYKPVALCITYCFISTYVGNYILKGSKTAYKFTIITTHPVEICQEITTVLQHSATRISAVGAYTKEEKAVLLCVVNKHQLKDFENIIARYDGTFSFYELINETYGNFKYIKK
jgi:uncharacterized membrane-anchored protein YitT (DUF2179 family)